MNRTLVDMARCMMQTKSLSKFYWAEAVKIANYILNRSITNSSDYITPYECWFEKKPNV